MKAWLTEPLYGPQPMEHEQLLRRLYAAFNARQLDAILAAMAEDVDWPNAMEGGRIHGRAGVRDYWTRQWATLDSCVEPLAIETRSDRRMAVAVHQVARTLDGLLLSEDETLHVYRFNSGLINRMDIEHRAP